MNNNINTLYRKRPAQSIPAEKTQVLGVQSRPVVASATVYWVVCSSTTNSTRDTNRLDRLIKKVSSVVAVLLVADRWMIIKLSSLIETRTPKPCG